MLQNVQHFRLLDVTLTLFVKAGEDFVSKHVPDPGRQYERRFILHPFVHKQWVSISAFT